MRVRVRVRVRATVTISMADSLQPAASEPPWDPSPWPLAFAQKCCMLDVKREREWDGMTPAASYGNVVSASSGLLNPLPSEDSTRKPFVPILWTVNDRWESPFQRSIDEIVS